MYSVMLDSSENLLHLVSFRPSQIETLLRGRPCVQF